LQDSAKRKGHFALFNCLVLGHTKYNGVQLVYCNAFPEKTFHGSHHLDLVINRPPGVDNRAFIVSPETVWYARVLLLFSASAATVTDTGSKSFECALVSTLEHTTVLRTVIILIMSLISVMCIICIKLINTFQVGWYLSVPVSYTS
jgi:hypothetical protein